jgi:SAM-dependent methyltransferase
MPVTAWLLDHLELQPGQRLLELAAGPGDTGFLAAEVVAPGGGVVICSDGAEAMVEVARRRAAELGVRGVEFRQLELEWIDLPTADVDRIVCRWGVMLVVDPAACLQECRRVLRPGGRLAVAVWDELDANPWASLPRRAIAEVLGEPPAAVAPEPGPFALAAPGRLQELLEDAGFTGVVVEPVAVARRSASVQAYLEETLSLSQTVRAGWDELSRDGRKCAMAALGRSVGPYRQPDGALVLPGRSLACAAAA